MIDAKELRIGNVFKEGKVCAIPMDSDEQVVLFDIGVMLDELTPIPLTPEIWKNIKLVSFDFAENFSCYIEYDGTVLIEQYHEGQEELKHIKYLHQLQNLCFALTGKELEINL